MLMMPKSLDVLIGLAVVMLVVSMTVTMLTQAITSLLNSDGKRLCEGLQSLLLQIDPGLSGITEEVSAAILTHPLIADSRGRFGAVVHRDEFTKLLLGLAAGSGVQNLKDTSRATLEAVLKKNGVDDPAAVLERIRLTALKLEQEHPAWASSFRHDTAIMQEASSHLVAKINSLFDQAIDRIAGRFTANARAVTFGCSILVALVLQLDTIGIVNNLWMSDTLRNRLVVVSTKINPEATPEQNSGSAVTEQPKFQQDLAQNVQNLEKLATNGLFLLPASFSSWRQNWDAVKIPGVILSALLLSLGAPFWYNSLKTLLRLRSEIAGKDDAQRVTRQTSQTDHGAGPTKFTT
jgi:hypothetical protein